MSTFGPLGLRPQKLLKDCVLANGPIIYET